MSGRDGGQASEIAQVIERFGGALDALGMKVSDAEIERWAVLIHRSMNLGRRRFHTAAHVLAVTRDLPPLATLAGLFHDLVYVQVDDGFPSQIAARLIELARPVGSGWELTAAIDVEPIALVAAIFGVQRGQVLGPFTGINELLSACVAVEALGHVLAPEQVVQLVACVEATIPFRGRDASGRDPFDRLAGRVTAACQARGVACSPDTLNRWLDEALQLANRDVANFADTDPGRFLTNTWTLLPETNRSLMGFGVYSIIEYRQSLQRMASFLDQLDPSVIFHQRSGRPGDAELAGMVARARSNVDIASRYLGVKLYAIAIVEAFARLSGGDAPIALFMGDVPSDQVAIRRAENQLPARSDSSDGDPVLQQLLHVGRASPSHFDLQNSPLSSYLYRALGERRLLSGLDHARAMFDGRADPSELLATVEPSIRGDLGRALATMVPTRRATLVALAGS